ncbi:MAG: hypothetical protein Fur0022_34630 [Anaerolineales bacterium]
MKTLFKILVILLSAMLIAGAAYALRRTDWGQSLLAKSGEERPEGAEMFTDGERPTPPDEDFVRDSASGFRLESLASFAKTLIPIALLIFMINTLPALFQSITRRFQRGPI